jgi:PPOX class probable F420-dependent enzyme
MSRSALQQFQGQRFLNLETFRRNGEPVRTPVGFVQDGDSLVIRTEANSGKVKRIRNDNHVRIVPSTGRGEPLGEWVDATATILDESASTQARQKIIAKYGLIWRLIEWRVAIGNRLGRRQGAGWVSIRLTPVESPTTSG